jgi:hypothetical protein
MAQELFASEVGAGRARANAAITLNNAVKIKSFISILSLVLRMARQCVQCPLGKKRSNAKAPKW